MMYHHAKRELLTIEQRVSVLTKKSEKYHPTSTTPFIEMQKIENNIRGNQDRLTKLMHAMFVHSKIAWTGIEIQKETIKISGDAHLITPLLAFIDYCEKKLNVTMMIKYVKTPSPFDKTEFQIQINQTRTEFKRNELD